MAAVNPIPDNYPRVSPYLYIDGAAAAIDFYVDVLGAEVRGDVMRAPDGKIGHAELELGGSLIMLADEFPDMGACSPKTLGGSAVGLHVYVEDADATVAAAATEGATIVRPVADQFYGDRLGQIEDPWGHRWSIASHIEDVSPDEMAKRAAASMEG